MPTAADVFGWLNLSPAVGGVEYQAMGRVLDAQRGWWADHVIPLPVTATAAQIATDDLAFIIACARLYQRTTSPNGTINLGEFGGLRVTSFDVDVERLLAGRVVVAFS